MNKDAILSKAAEEFEWYKWDKEIPYLNFDNDWLVKARPPFGTGIIRYAISHKDHEDVYVSVYLDCYDMAGVTGKQPYWEVYPYPYEDYQDVYRCKMTDTDELLQAIRKSVNNQIVGSDK